MTTLTICECGESEEYNIDFESNCRHCGLPIIGIYIQSIDEEYV
jgi:hypothetical protein